MIYLVSFYISLNSMWYTAQTFALHTLLVSCIRWWLYLKQAQIPAPLWMSLNICAEYLFIDGRPSSCSLISLIATKQLSFGPSRQLIHWLRTSLMTSGESIYGKFLMSESDLLCCLYHRKWKWDIGYNSVMYIISFLLYM